MCDEAEAASEGRGDRRLPPWIWLQLLSLDAVAVAVVWQGLLGALWEVPLTWADRLVLALTVWLIYVGDRWLDARRGKADTLRHRFYGRHGRFFFGAMVVVAPLTGLLALGFLSWKVLFDGLLLCLGVCLYLALVNLGPLWLAKLKPYAVGVIFALGCALAPLAGLPAIHPWQVMLVVAFMIAAVLNCLIVAYWERGGSAEISEKSESGSSTLRPQLAAYLILGVVLIYYFLSTVVKVVGMSGPETNRLIAESIAVSCSRELWVPIITISLVLIHFHHEEAATPTAIKNLRADFLTLLPSLIAWLYLALLSKPI